MAKVAEFMMVRIVILIMEKMILYVEMTDTMLSIWEY